MNHKIINLLDFKYPSTLYNNESEQIFMKAVNSRKTKLVLKKTKLVLNENTAKKPAKILHESFNEGTQNLLKKQKHFSAFLFTLY